MFIQGPAMFIQGPAMVHPGLKGPERLARPAWLNIAGPWINIAGPWMNHGWSLDDPWLVPSRLGWSWP